MLYNYTGINTFTGMMTWMNTVTGNVFWTVMTLTIFAVIFLILSQSKIENGILASAFITSTIAIVLRSMGLVSDALVVIFILLTAFIGVFKFYFSKE